MNSVLIAEGESTMQIPALLCGLEKEVARAASKAVSSRPINLQWVNEKSVPVSEAKGLLLLGGERYFAGTDNVRFYALETALVAKAVKQRAPVSDDDMASLVKELVQFPWGGLALMNPGTSLFLQRNPGFDSAFLATCLRHWRAWDACGDRFSIILDTGEPWWKHAHTLYNVLVRRGAGAAKDIMNVISNGGIEEVVSGCCPEALHRQELA